MGECAPRILPKWRYLYLNVRANPSARCAQDSFLDKHLTSDRAAVRLLARRHLVLSHLSVVCRRLSSSVGQTFLSLPGTRNCYGNPAFSSLLKACPRQPRLLDRPRFRRKSSSYRAILPAGVRSRCSDGFRLFGSQISKPLVVAQSTLRESASAN